jgi:hypothetical protein
MKLNSCFVPIARKKTIVAKSTIVAPLELRK